MQIGRGMTVPHHNVMAQNGTCSISLSMDNRKLIRMCPG